MVYIKEINADTYVVDHLHRHPDGQNKYWMLDRKPVEEEQILEVVVEG